MTQRQRLLAVFCGEPVDHLPWAADLTYWYGARVHDNTVDEEHRGKEGFVRLHRDLGVCCYYVYYGQPMRSVSDDSVQTESSEEEGVSRTTIRTPLGSLTQENRWLPRSYCHGRTKPYVETPEDLRVLRYIVEHRSWEATPDSYREHQALLGEDGLAPGFVPRAPLSAMIAEWAGLTNTALLLADAREEMECTLDAIAASNAPALRLAAESEAPLYHFGDNLSAENIGGLFDRYLRDYYRHAAEVLHEGGKFVAVHVDGTMRGLLHRFRDTGVDAIESLTPWPVGDVALEDLRAVAQDENVILWGGLPGAMFSPAFSSQDIRDMTEKILALFGQTGRRGPRGRFIVGSADQVPPDGRIEDVRMVSDILAESAA